MWRCAYIILILIIIVLFYTKERKFEYFYVGIVNFFFNAMGCPVQVVWDV